MDELNYSVKPMIDSFNLKDFLKNKGDHDKHSAFLLITRKQLLCGYTGNNGSNYHLSSLANAIREIYNMPLFEKINDQVLLEDKIESSFITGRFISDVDAGIFLAFSLQNLKSISSEEFELFKYFYDKYNDVIDYYSKKYNTPLVFASLPNENGFKDEYGNEVNLLCNDNLDYVYKYLNGIIKPERKLIDDSKILGITLEKRREEDSDERNSKSKH